MVKNGKVSAPAIIFHARDGVASASEESCKESTEDLFVRSPRPLNTAVVPSLARWREHVGFWRRPKDAEARKRCPHFAELPTIIVIISFYEGDGEGLASNSSHGPILRRH